MKAAVEKASRRDRELRRSRRRGKKKNSFALAENSAGQWTKKVGLWRWELRNALFSFFFLLTMQAVVLMFSLFVPYFSISVPALTALNKFLNVLLAVSSP